MRVLYACLFVTISYAQAGDYGKPVVIARLEVPGLSESSGLTASRLNPGILWSHNDSGNGPDLFAINSLDGKFVGRWSVTGARNYDWEDLAVGPGPKPAVSYLYIGDIGDNNRKRQSVVVYRIPEPYVRSPSRATVRSEVLTFRYPDGPHDAEALLVHPSTGDLYVVTKAKGEDGKTLVFKASAPLSEKRIILLKQQDEIQFPNQSIFSLITGRVTGGAISPDGRRVVLCDYIGGWEAVLSPNTSFDSIWRRKWRPVDLGERQQGEAVTYSRDGKSVFATSEGAVTPLIGVGRTR